MKKLFLIFALLSFPAFGQNGRWDLQATTVQAQGGNLLPVYAIPGATVSFLSCSSGLVTSCTTPATTYNGAGAACPSDSQVNPQGSLSCTTTADTAGNFGAFFANGTYAYTLTANGSSYGPFLFSVGSGSSCGDCVLTDPTGSQNIVQPADTIFTIEGKGGASTGGRTIITADDADDGIHAGKIGLQAGGTEVLGSFFLTSNTANVAADPITSNYTFSITDRSSSTYVIDASSNSLTFTLPAVLDGADISVYGLVLALIRKDATPAGNIVTVAPTSPGLIMGKNSFSLENGQSVLLHAQVLSTGQVYWTLPNSSFLQEGDIRFGAGSGDYDYGSGNGFTGKFEFDALTGNRALVVPDTSGRMAVTVGTTAPGNCAIYNGSGDLTGGICSGGGGSGTVTTFSAGNLSPLFSTSVANATTTPTLTFSTSTVAQNSFLAGPSTGGTGAYSFRGIAPADLPLASSSVFGAVKVDGTSITASGGVISAVSGGSGTVTTTGSPSSGQMSKFSGATSITNAVAGTDYQAPITLTTTGTSGAATYISNTLNIPQYSGGSGGAYLVSNETPGTASSAAFAFKGNIFTPNVNMHIAALWIQNTALVSGGVYAASVAPITGPLTGPSTSSAATFSNSYTAAASSTMSVRLVFASPVALTAGTSYALLVGRTDATGTYILPIPSTATSSLALLPGFLPVVARAASTTIPSGTAIDTNSATASGTNIAYEYTIP